MKRLRYTEIRHQAKEQEKAKRVERLMLGVTQRDRKRAKWIKEQNKGLIYSYDVLEEEMDVSRLCQAFS